MTHNDQVCLITGTRKGIGNYLARYYLKKGLKVIGCSRSKSEISFDNYTHYSLDVADEGQMKKMFYEIKARHSRLDFLINNAGTASMNHSILTPAKVAHKLVSTNLVGAFIACREAAKLMMKKRFGRIINFTTVAVPLKLEGEAMYAASKAALVTLTQILAKEYAEYGITVNAIGPTPIKTDLIKSVPEEKIQRILELQAIKRYGDFSDISNAIDFLIRFESQFITGQVIYLGGVS